MRGEGGEGTEKACYLANGVKETSQKVTLG